MYLRETRQKRADGSYLTHLQLAESSWDPVKGQFKIRVVGHKGKGAIDRFLLGSATSRIAQHAECSVLAVRIKAISE